MEEMWRGRGLDLLLRRLAFPQQSGLSGIGVNSAERLNKMKAPDNRPSLELLNRPPTT